MKSKLGLTGYFYFICLILVSIITISIVPSSTFQEWNNPEKWISYPKTISTKLGKFFIFREKFLNIRLLMPNIFESQNDGVFPHITAVWLMSFNYDDFPSDFIFETKTKYSNSYLVQIKVYTS